MQVKDREAWNTSLKNNSQGRIDDYGGCVMFFAEHWANLMECAMANRKTLEECADASSHRADDDLGQWGVTGFQYGAAVSTLSQCWEHGEELRKWHNLKTQIRDEGEKANESGGVLNPAIICIGKD